MHREWQYKSYYIRLEEHPNVYMVRIFKDLLAPPLSYMEMGPKSRGAKMILDEARKFIDGLTTEKGPAKTTRL